MDAESVAERGGPGPRGGIQSLHRAFDILEFVGQFEVVGATKIAQELDLSVSTVNNLCRTMADRGYLIGRRGQYRLGPAFSLSAARWDPMAALPDVVRPVIARLSERTGQASVVTVLTGMNAHVIAFEQGRGAVGTPRPRDDRPALHLPTGTVLVALSRPSQWDDFVRAGVPDLVEVDPSRWHEELEMVAREQACARTSADPQGQTALAVPVWAPGGTVACALGASAPAYLVDEDLAGRMFEALIQAAHELSVELGASAVPEVSRDVTWRHGR